MKENKYNDRVLYTDVLRVISIFAIILLHVSSKNMWAYSVFDKYFKVYTVYSCLTRWGVPVFFMISGSFLLKPEKEITDKKIKTYCVRLLVAYVIWTWIYAVWNTICAVDFSLDVFDVQEFLKLALNGPYHFWFMFVMFGLYIVTPYLRKVVATSTKDELKKLLYIWGGLSIIVPVMKTYNFIPSLINLIDNIKMVYCTGYFGYYLLGWYLSEYQVKERRNDSFCWLIFFISIVLTICLTFQREFMLGCRDDFWQGNFSPTVVLGAITLFLGFKNLEDYFQKILSIKYKHFLSILANESFGVYLIHDMFITLLWRLEINTMRFNPTLSVPIISALVIVLSFSMCVCWNRIRGCLRKTDI